jgi:hypothetical protein
VSDTRWTRLRAPFPATAIAWDPVEFDPAGEVARLAPRLERDALAERLDEVLGPGGWSVRFAAAGGGVACTLQLGEVTRGAVADVVAVVSEPASRAADRAFAAAAALAGMRPGATVSRWVPYDPEAGAVMDDEVLATEGPAAGAPPATPVAGGVAVDSAPASAVVAPPSDGAGPDDVLRAAAEARGLTSEGQRMIDRLLERLKDEGQGLAAARLLVKYGGYGKDPEAARELYAKLRELLIRAGERAEVQA